jgi:siroheme synthase
VVRLKSGDPLLFGRAVEELEALAQAGVPFEIVPGVSTGFAAAALADCRSPGALPIRGCSLPRGIWLPERPTDLAGITPEVTLVLYMPGKDYRAIAAELAPTAGARRRAAWLFLRWERALSGRLAACCASCR